MVVAAVVHSLALPVVLLVFCYEEEQGLWSSLKLLFLDEGQGEDGLEGEVAVEWEDRQPFASLSQEAARLLLLGIEETEGEEGHESPSHDFCARPKFCTWSRYSET